MSFHVGQKVVCVDAGDRGSHHYMPLVKGRIYRIAAFGLHPEHPTAIAVHLVGVRRIWNNYDFPFGITRFRPIVARKTSIEIFERMLTPNKVRTDA